MKQRTRKPSSTRRGPWLPALVAAVALGASGASCANGTIGGDGDGTIDTSKAPLCTKLQPGSAPVRRMTRFEYNQTIRALLGDTSDLADGFVPEEESLGFNNQAEALGITQLLAEQYLEASEKIAASAVGKMSSLLPCDPKTGDDACAAKFIQTFGKKAYRRPLEASEVTDLTSVYASGKAKYDFATGIQWALEAMLNSPQFLYRVEFGMPNPVEADVVPLTQYEVASRLSYLLWSTMPDDALMQAADKGELATADQIAQQARRMLDDEKARKAVANFHTQWLRLQKVDTMSKDPTVYPKFNDALKPLFKEETLDFLDRLVFDEKGTVADVFSAPYTMMNKDLASFYGVSGPAGDAFEKVSLDVSKRQGILTHASVLSVTAKENQSSPVQRGKYVRERFLCQGIPPPPANLKIVPPEIKTGMTTRERFAEHDKNPNCFICHKLMDPIGFGFEHFDGIGLWRDKDQGLAIDATGEVIGSADMDGKFDGVVGLDKMLAGSQAVRECVATQWFRFGYGRAASDEDQCNVQQLDDAFKASGYTIKELLVALTQTDAFRYRHQVVPGGGQ